MQHPRLNSPVEISRNVIGLDMSSNGIFKVISSRLRSGETVRRREPFMEWHQCESGEPINLVVDAPSWRRDGADIRFQLSIARPPSANELAVVQDLRLPTSETNPFVALEVNSDTTLLIDTVTLIERVVLCNPHAYRVAATPFRELAARCFVDGDAVRLEQGPLGLFADFKSLCRRPSNGGLSMLVTWLSQPMWAAYLDSILASIRAHESPPLPLFSVSGWMRYDGWRVNRVLVVESVTGVIDQIAEYKQITMVGTSIDRTWRAQSPFRRRCKNGINFDDPFAFDRVQIGACKCAA